MCRVKFIATEEHSEEVSRGQEEIRPIHGKIGSFVAIKNPSPDASAAQEAAQVLIVRAVAQLPLCAPAFRSLFLNTRYCSSDTPPQDPVTWTDVL